MFRFVVALFFLHVLLVGVRAQELVFERQVFVPLDDPVSCVRDFVFTADGSLIYSQFAGGGRHELVRVRDPLGQCAADVFTSGVQYANNGNGNGVAIDAAGCVYLSSFENKWIRKFLPDGKPDVAFGDAGTLKVPYYSPRSLSVGNGVLAVSGFSATDRDYIYFYEAATGAALSSALSKADTDDRGPGAALKDEAFGGLDFGGVSGAFYANGQGDVVRFAAAQTAFEVVGFHAQYPSVAHGVAVNERVGYVAHSAGYFGRQSSLMVWLTSLATGECWPLYPATVPTSEQYLGKSVGAMRWYSHGGVDYLFVANAAGRCFNVYRFVAPLAAKPKWKFVKAIDLSAAVGAAGAAGVSRVRALTVLADYSLLMSCFEFPTGTLQNLWRVKNPLTDLTEISRWSENFSYVPGARDLTLDEEGSVYFTVATPEFMEIHKLTRDGVHDERFGLNGISSPSVDGVRICPEHVVVAGRDLFVSHRSYDTLAPHGIVRLNRETGQVSGPLLAVPADGDEDGILDMGGVVWNGMCYDIVSQNLFVNAKGSLLEVQNFKAAYNENRLLNATRILRGHRVEQANICELAADFDLEYVAYTVAADRELGKPRSATRTQPVTIGVLDLRTGAHEYVAPAAGAPGCLNWGGTMCLLNNGGDTYLLAVSHFDNRLNVFAKDKPASVGCWSEF